MAGALQGCSGLGFAALSVCPHGLCTYGVVLQGAKKEGYTWGDPKIGPVTIQGAH